MKPFFPIVLAFTLAGCRGAENLPDAGQPAPACVIDSTSHEAGASDPRDACAVCDPTRSTMAWSARADGVPCAAGSVCGAGRCASQCFLDGLLFAPGAANPDDGCEACDPARSTTQWSARADGTGCGGGEVCVAGECRAKCLIEGGLVSASELNPANPCEQCTPATSTTSWSSRMNGASCAGGKVCEAGACTARCFIGGTFFDAGAVNPANPCERCDPASGTNAWSLRENGASCGAGQVCGAGACVSGCFIDGAVQAANAVNPQNACEQCDPANTTRWSARADGTSCAAGRVCEAATCTTKCFIDGGLHAEGAVSPGSACEVCSPAASTTGWTPRATVPLFVPGQDLAAQGWSLQQSGLASVTSDDAGVRLVTSTASGASSGGILLMHRPVVDAGTPFTLRAELLVESVNAHNPFDSAAAILGAFTPPFALSAQRAQMIYLDANAVGWADDTQSAAIAVTNGQYRTYEFSVDGANTARLSVDGVPTLTRANFVSSGTIAIGDQTNDANVDATMRIRSVSRVCP